MQKPSEYRILLELDNSRYSGRNTSQSNTTVKQMLPILLMGPGVFLNLLAMGTYPPLDRLPMGLMIGIFLLPFVLLLLSFAGRRSGLSPRHSQMIFISSSVGLCLLAILLFVNGRLDRSPLHQESPTVIRKSITRGRQGTQYYLMVSSWRPGRSLETFHVTAGVYNRSDVGKSVRVDVHEGYFGIPWRGSISPE